MSPEQERTLDPSDGLADRPALEPCAGLITLTATLGEAGYIGCEGLELPWEPALAWRRARPDNGMSVMIPFCPARGHSLSASVHSSRTFMALWSSDSRIWFASLARPLVRGDKAAAFTALAAALAAAAATCAATSFCLAACELMPLAALAALAPRPGGSKALLAGLAADGAVGGGVEGVDTDSAMCIPGNSYTGG